MTQEEKELLIKDLCARLPHGVYVKYENDGIEETRELGLGTLHDFMFGNAVIKPYLRPMSSMTEDESIEFSQLFDRWHDAELFDYIEEGVDFSIWKHKGISASIFDWLNEHHFEYRGLIPMGLAIEAPKDMYAV